jgi:integrase
MYDLTETSIKSIPVTGKSQEIMFDREHLIGYVNKDWNPGNGEGKIVLRIRYSVNGMRRKFKLGSWPQMTVKQLASAYTVAAGKVAAGEDPQEERRQGKVEAEQARIDDQNARTVAQVGQDFVDWSKNNKKSWKEDERIYNKYILTSPVAKILIQDVHRRHLAEIVNKITDSGAPIMANRVRAWLSKCFNRALENGYIEVHPANRLPSNKERERDRILSEAELVKFWNAIDHIQNEHQRRAVRLTVLTGQRLSEIISLHSDHIEGSWWTNPETKNGMKHRVPLSGLALEQVDVEGWVFPGRGVDHINGSTFGHLVPRVAELAGIDRCTAHDLRRTLGTFIQSRFGSEIMHRVLNHVEDKLTRTYGLYDFDAEKEKALLAWEREIKRIASIPQDNVIQLSA